MLDGSTRGAVVVWLAAVGVAGAVGGCVAHRSGAGGLVQGGAVEGAAEGPVSGVDAEAPRLAAPEFRVLTEPGVVQREVLDLTDEGAVVWSTVAPEVIDTRTFPVQVQDVGAPDGVSRRTKEILPAHRRPVLPESGEVFDFPVGRTLPEPRAAVESQFSALDSTGWTPPDPTLAVGPDHVVVTVNQSVAWYAKSTGAVQFSAILGSQGNPGFFETVGAGSFAFDPKCFYDHLSQRFVIVVLEVSTTTAYVDVAVSDDADPNGVWYKYRTPAVIDINGNDYWWDYPGAGYDADAYYVTSNLFPLSAGGFGGAGFRIFDKAPMLAGQPAVYATLRSEGNASVQACQHFGDNPAAYFAALGNNSRVRLLAVTDPLTNPVIHQQSLPVTTFSGPVGAPVLGGGSLDVVDARIMNCQWRDGRVWATHNISVGGVNKVRWYELDVLDWPFAGSFAVAQQGDVDAGAHAFFGAIYENDRGATGLVFGASSSNERVSMHVTGRRPSDPAGEMGEATLVRAGTRSGTSGRWGDYYDIALDPDGVTFWAIGQTDESGIGWDTRVASFTVEVPCPGDLTGDGEVNLDDVVEFASTLPDLTGDTAFTLDDVAAFVDVFSLGCP